MALSYQQTKLIQGTIPALREHGELITSQFYADMLSNHPELRDVFNNVNQTTGRQPRALTDIILAFAANINHTSELIPRMERMCNKHCSLNIQPQQYEIVGKYLIAAYVKVLGPIMTPDVQAAWTKAYWILAKMLIGRETQLYREFSKWVGWRRFKIDRKVAESDDIFSFYLIPEDGKPLVRFQPGQYISVRLNVPGLGYLQSRQYSLSDSPTPDFFRITVKRDQGTQMGDSLKSIHIDPGVVSNLLIDRKRPGDIIEVTHPAGDFYLDIETPSSVPLVLISAGVGVTPLMSIFNTVVENQPNRPVAWVHCSSRSAPFEQHVRQTARTRSNITTTFFKSQIADGDDASSFDFDLRMDLARIEPHKLYLDNSSAEYYICGPEVFIAEMAQYLLDQGVHKARVRYEWFTTGRLDPDAK